MEKYVNVETVRSIFRDWACCTEDVDEFMSDIDGASTADVAPVVHCRDCFHWSNVGGGWCNQFDFRASPDLACNAGERYGQAQ